MSLESTFKRKTMKRKAWAGWSGWIQVSEVICGKRKAARVKEKVYKMVMRPGLMYGLETVVLKKPGGGILNSF